MSLYQHRLIFSRFDYFYDSPDDSPLPVWSRQQTQHVISMTPPRPSHLFSILYKYMVAPATGRVFIC